MYANKDIYERNAEMLEKIPHKEIEDMAVVCRLVVGNDETTGLGTILINNDMLQNFGITEEQLFADAARELAHRHDDAQEQRSRQNISGSERGIPCRSAGSSICQSMQS